MSKWNRERKISIPGMNPPKTIVCGVCGSEIIPNKDSRYTVRDRLCTGGIGNALGGSYTEPKEFDAFDCKVCGCQSLAKERLKNAQK